MESDLKVGDRVKFVGNSWATGEGTILRVPEHNDGHYLVAADYPCSPSFPEGEHKHCVWHSRSEIEPIATDFIKQDVVSVEGVETPVTFGAFTIKDSGKRQEFASGMVRDTADDKMQYHRVFDGPMFQRWAEHLTKGAKKYPDTDGQANWMKAAGQAEYIRFRQSALRHFVQWFYGDRDEDHAAAVFFNINGAEYVRENLNV